MEEKESVPLGVPAPKRNTARECAVGSVDAPPRGVLAPQEGAQWRPALGPVLSGKDRPHRLERRAAPGGPHGSESAGRKPPLSVATHGLLCVTLHLSGFRVLANWEPRVQPASFLATSPPGGPPTEPCSLCSLHIKEAPAMCQGHKYWLHLHMIFLLHEPLFLTFITKRKCLLCLKMMSAFPFPDRKCFSGMLHWSIQHQKQARSFSG